MRVTGVLSGLVCATILLLTPSRPAIAQNSVQEIESPYNSIVVRRYGSTVTLGFRVGRCEFIESSKDLSRPHELVVDYTRSSTAALVYPAQLRAVLEIGVGGATTLSYLHTYLPETRLTGVEIDPGVVSVAKKDFGLTEDGRLKIVVDDGRKYLAATQDRFDLIMIDAYRGTWVPETLTSVEFFSLVKARLAEGGAVAQNVEPTTLFYDGLAATLAKVFDHVDAYPTESFGQPGNVVLIAYNGKRKTRTELRAKAVQLQRRYGFFHPLPAIVETGRQATFESGAAPFRDGAGGANIQLMIDRSNARNTPRVRKEQCE